MYSISEFSEKVNISPSTLRRWDTEGTLCPIKIGTGQHRRYTEEHVKQVRQELSIKNSNRLNVIYCRESTKAQKSSLDLQIEQCKMFCVSSGLKIDHVLTDFGSGMNFKSRDHFNELISMICDFKIEHLIIYHKDRLCRFSYDLIEFLCSKFNTKIIVIDNTNNDKSKEQEFVDDIIAIIHHFSMKLYGSRSYKKRIKEVEEKLIMLKTECETCK